MMGKDLSLPFLKRNDELPYYFDKEDVHSIFDACINFEHYAMLQTIFYACLVARELCNLDDKDLDLKTLTIPGDYQLNKSLWSLELPGILFFPAVLALPAAFPIS
jgi:integrase